jgi:hypothetical protein
MKRLNAVTSISLVALSSLTGCAAFGDAMMAPTRMMARAMGQEDTSALTMERVNAVTRDVEQMRQAAPEMRKAMVQGHISDDEQQLQAVSSGIIGCSPGAIGVSKYKLVAAISTWKASCKRKYYYCSGRDVKDVACKEVM